MHEWMTMPDDAEWVRMALVFAGIALTIGVSEFLRKAVRVGPETSRKAVHILVGGGLLFAPRLFISPVPLIVLSSLFAVLNALAIRKGWLKGMHGPSRASLGTVYFPLSLLVLTLALWHRSPEVVVLAMFSFSLGDAAAAIAGTRIARPTLYRLTGDAKSVQGSAAMFVVTFASVIAGFDLLWPDLQTPWLFVIMMAGAVATIGTAWEGLSSRALDNLTVPLAHALVLSVFLLPSPMAPVEQFLVGISLSLVLATASYMTRLLSPDGAVATFVLGCIVFGLGGWQWAVPMVVFFLFSSLLSMMGKNIKTDLTSVFEKSSTRDHGQVAANGGVAGLVLLAQYAFPGLSLYPAYIGAIAAVTADTWATEVGVLSRGRTVSLVTFADVPRGSSGGVSVAGTVAGAAGALFIALLGGQWAPADPVLVAGLFGGMAGMTADSLLGETLQARYRCSECGSETERSEHCGRAAVLTRGRRWLRNDGVNWACAAVGAAVGGLVAGV